MDFNGKTTRLIVRNVQWEMTAVAADPESKVLSHPIKIAAKEWIAVTGALLARWESGRITEEYLFLQGLPPMMNPKGSGQ